MDIYGKYKEALEAVMAHTARQIEEYGAAEQETTGKCSMSISGTA